MSDELIQSLKQQLRGKDAEIGKLTEESIRRKHSVRELRAQVQALTGERDGLVKERDGFKAKAEVNPDAAAGEIERLRGELRTYKHRDGLAELAHSAEIGLSGSVPIDRVMRLMDYRPESDEFDPQSARQKLVALKQSDPYLFGPAGGAGNPAAGQAAAVLSPSVAGLGSAMGRGSSPSPTSAPGALTEDQMRDPVFMSDYNRRMRTGK